MKLKIFIFILTLYAITPFFAGIFAIGELTGPKIYLVDHHVLFYRIGYAITHEDTARYNLKIKRPLFYQIHQK